MVSMTVQASSSQICGSANGDSVGGKLPSATIEFMPRYLSAQHCLKYYLSNVIQEQHGNWLLKIPQQLIFCMDGNINS